MKITPPPTMEIPDEPEKQPTPKKKKRHLSPAHRAKSLRALKKARAAKKSGLGSGGGPRPSGRKSRRVRSFAARTTQLPFVAVGSTVAAGALPDQRQIGARPSGDVTNAFLQVTGPATSRQRVSARFPASKLADHILLMQVQYGVSYR